MNILSIETSCDETAVSVVSASGDFPHATYTVLGNGLFSQIDIHREYGGVFPALAKREHAKTLVPMLTRALQEAKLLEARELSLNSTQTQKLDEILDREPGLSEALCSFLTTYERPDVGLIAVTSGPGLEPALWVGINFARALAEIWDIPIVPINHMEGHVLSSIFDGTTIPEIAFPAIALLISGGHTELVLMRDWVTYELLGQTRDDAVGEAFDKVARMLGLPYPGGPEISKLAYEARERTIPTFITLPRPMIDSKDLDFSFSGLKTAVRYAIGEKKLTHDERASLAREFEDSVTTVLLRKSRNAVLTHDAQTLIIGGGVSANTHIRETFKSDFHIHHPTVMVYMPPRNLSTDNGIMIALAGHARKGRSLLPTSFQHVRADGNLKLANTQISQHI